MVSRMVLGTVSLALGILAKAGPGSFPQPPNCPAGLWGQQGDPGRARAAGTREALHTLHLRTAAQGGFLSHISGFNAYVRAVSHET